MYFKFLGIGLAVLLIIFILSLFELYTQLGRYKTYWQRNNQQPAAQNEILYIALGDSTAQGIGATSPAKAYPGIIKKELEKRQDKPVRLINVSRSGAKVKDVLDEQIAAMKNYPINDKTIITMEIGANDMISFDAAKFEKEMVEVMQLLPKQTIISDIPYFGQSRYKSKQPNVDAANKIMYRLATKNNFQLAPLNEKMRTNGGVKVFAVDWFHPSNIAYRQNWAPVFLDRIKL